MTLRTVDIALVLATDVVAPAALLAAWLLDGTAGSLALVLGLASLAYPFVASNLNVPCPSCSQHCGLMVTMWGNGLRAHVRLVSCCDACGGRVRKGRWRFDQVPALEWYPIVAPDVATQPVHLGAEFRVGNAVVGALYDGPVPARADAVENWVAQDEPRRSTLTIEKGKLNALSREIEPDTPPLLVGEHSLDARSDEAAAVRLLGPPYWRDEDDDEVLLFYERAGVEAQLEFEAKRTLSHIVLTAKPIMADAAQRAAYGVTKPWPPGAVEAEHE